MYKKILYWIVLAIIFLFAFLVRVLVTDFQNPIVDGSDSATYHYAAKNILKYGVLTYDRSGEMFYGVTEVTPTTLLSAGLPIFLSFIYLFIESASFIYWIQVILSMCIIILIYAILKLLEVSKVTVIIVFFCVSFYPAYIYNLDLILTETLFTTLICLFLYLFLRTIIYKEKMCRWLIYTNLVLMAAIHIKGSAFIIIPIEILVCMFYLKNSSEYKIKMCMTIISVMVVTLVPFWIYSILIMEKFSFFYTSGEGPKIWGAQPYYIDMSNTNGITLNELIEKNISTNATMYYNWRVFGSVVMMWRDFWDERLVHPCSLLYYFRMVHVLVILPTIIMQPLLLLVRKNKEIIFMVCIILASSISCMFYHGLPRYVFPYTPIVFILFGIIIDEIFRIFKRSKKVLSVIETQKSRAESVVCISLTVISTLFSLLLVYSIFIFSNSIDIEMSNYFLGTYLEINTEDVDEMPIIYSEELLKTMPTKIIMENVEQLSDGSYDVIGENTALMHVDVDITNEEEVVTKINLKISGGYLYDYYTIYWMGTKTDAYSEDMVFARVPRNIFSDTITVYIPEDVTSLLIVPVGFRGGNFSINEFRVTKYSVNTN